MGKSKGRIKQVFIIINLLLFAGLLFLSYKKYQEYQDNIKNTFFFIFYLISIIYDNIII